jgi:hypothetical protein
MNNQQVNSMSLAATVILALLLTIILRVSLESFFIPLTSGRTLREFFGAGAPATETWLRTWQFAIFLVLLARFYGGAFRFNAEQPPEARIADAILNLAGTFALFSLFYVVALNIWTLDLFYVFVFAMHVFDFVWFFIVLQRLEVGSPFHQPVKLFLLFDLLTLVAFAALFVPPSFRTGILDRSYFSYQWGALLVLLVISVADWVFLRDFYFRPERWRQKHQRAAAA